jgi:PHD/YefM family antitoxin component YafN of YafNO toxin-antitoxin module
MIDRVFNESMSTREIFDSEGKKLVLSALEGFNVTIFTYGQTASGKTFTMRGAGGNTPGHDNQGIIPLALKEIFRGLYTSHGQPFKPHQAMATHPAGSGRDSLISPRSGGSSSLSKLVKTWIVKVSYIEIYNECVNDLLDPSRKNLSVRENQQGRAIVDNLSEFEVQSLEETLYYLVKGDEQRKIAETRLNEKSSRSHTVFKINLYLSEKNLQTGRNHIKTS